MFLNGIEIIQIRVIRYRFDYNILFIISLGRFIAKTRRIVIDDTDIRDTQNYESLTVLLDGK